MPNYKIDNITYRLKEQTDLSFLSSYGEVFCVFDGNDSGTYLLEQIMESKNFLSKLQVQKQLTLAFRQKQQ